MDDNTKLIESVLERAAEYGKTSYELVKLKVLDKTADEVSSLIPNSFVFIIASTFILFFNLGIAFWLGEILGKVYFGFLVLAAFYFVVAIILNYFMHNWLKRVFYDYIIKQMFK